MAQAVARDGATNGRTDGRSVRGPSPPLLPNTEHKANTYRLSHSLAAAGKGGKRESRSVTAWDPEPADAPPGPPAPAQRHGLPEGDPLPSSGLPLSPTAALLPLSPLSCPRGQRQPWRGKARREQWSPSAHRGPSAAGDSRLHAEEIFDALRTDGALGLVLLRHLVLGPGEMHFFRGRLRFCLRFLARRLRAT